MKINKFLVVVIAILCVVLAFLCAEALKGPEEPGSENSASISDDPVSESDGGESKPGTEKTVFPEEITIRKLVRSTLDDIRAEDFVFADEAIDYKVEFASPPDKSVFGDQTVILRFDIDGDLFQRYAQLYLFEISDNVVFELSGEGKAAVGDFISDTSVDASFVNADPASLDLSVAGKREVTVSANGVSYTVSFEVCDTTPPAATAKEQSVSIGKSIPASNLVTDIVDLSAVTCSYENEPDWNESGDHEVVVLLTDSYGNTARCQSIIHIIAESDALTFYGLSEIKICVGDTISYRTDVSCLDKEGNSVSFKIDASGVDRNKQGTYYAVYSATDENGYTLEKNRTIIVSVVTEELVNSLCDEILSDIIKDNYSRDTRIKAVWRWVKNNVTYTGSSVSYENELRVAYAAFESHSGDCYTYYIANKYLLNRLGIENVEVRRVESVTRHWWNLVKFADGKWYHVDSCPHPKQSEKSTFKMTETDLLWFTELFKSSRHPNYYEYDHSLAAYADLKIAK